MAKALSSPPYSVPPTGDKPFAAQWQSWLRELHAAVSAVLVAQPVTLLIDATVTVSPYVATLNIYVPRAALLIITGSFVQSQSGTGQFWQATVAVNGSTIYDTGASQPFQASVSIAGQVQVAAGYHTVIFTWLQSSTTYTLHHLEVITVASLI